MVKRKATTQINIDEKNFAKEGIMDSGVIPVETSDKVEKLTKRMKKSASNGERNDRDVKDQPMIVSDNKELEILQPMEIQEIESKEHQPMEAQSDKGKPVQAKRK